MVDNGVLYSPSGRRMIKEVEQTNTRTHTQTLVVKLRRGTYVVPIHPNTNYFFLKIPTDGRMFFKILTLKLFSAS